jgi:hypothetical protein
LGHLRLRGIAKPVQIDHILGLKVQHICLRCDTCVEYESIREHAARHDTVAPACADTVGVTILIARIQSLRSCAAIAVNSGLLAKPSTTVCALLSASVWAQRVAPDASGARPKTSR